VPAVTWVDDVVVTGALGMAPATPADVAYLTLCTGGANRLAFRVREEAGYVDDPATSPGEDVELGVVQIAVANYRNRGATAGPASFDDTAGPALAAVLTAGTKRQLGVPRPVSA
jgi:hypothetical protein